MISEFLSSSTFQVLMNRLSSLTSPQLTGVPFHQPQALVNISSAAAACMVVVYCEQMDLYVCVCVCQLQGHMLIIPSAATEVMTTQNTGTQWAERKH